MSKSPFLPHLVKPSGIGSSHPVEDGVEIWEADFMDRSRHPDLNLDRAQWPPQHKRDLIVEFAVRRGEVPNHVVWKYARKELDEAFQGNLRRIR